MMQTERKYDDETGIRFTKDDQKTQSTIERRGVTEAPKFDSHADAHWMPEANTNGALAPVIQPNALKAEMSHLHHVEHIDDRSIPSMAILSGGDDISSQSMPIVENGIIQVEKTEPIMSKPVKSMGARKLSGDPVPSQLELPGAIGEKAAEGFDAILARAQPQIEKAKELYQHWKGEENKQIHGSAKPTNTTASAAAPSSGATMLETAKEKMHDLQSSIQPMVHDLQAKATETIGMVQRKGADKINELKAKRGAEKKYSAPKHEDTETLQHRAIRYRNKAIEVWQGQEPMVKEQIAKGAALAKQYKLELPLLALATLVVLWASISFIGWLAFPSVTNHHVVMENSPPVDFHPNGLVQEHLSHGHVLETMQPMEHVPIGLHQGLTGKAWRQHEHATGPLQDVPNAGTIDKLMLKLNAIEEKLQHSIDTLKMKTQDQLGHIKDAMPSDIHLGDRVGHIMPASAPSMADIKQQIPSMADIKEQIPSMADIKDRMPSMDSLKDGVQTLKDKVTGVTSGTDNLRSGIERDGIYSADLGQSPVDDTTHQVGGAHGRIPAHDHILEGGRVEHVPQHQH